jgi:hypothetical protein
MTLDPTRSLSLPEPGRRIRLWIGGHGEPAQRDLDAWLRCAEAFAKPIERVA